MEAELFSATTPVFRVDGRAVRPCRPHGYAGKRLFDLLLAGCLAPFVLPVMLGLWALVRLDGKPALVWHVRVGRNGENFRCLKFRSTVLGRGAMPATAPRGGGPCADRVLASSRPAQTRSGALLRRTGLDNLPQFWNVILGEMSFVGPSPVAPCHLARYGMARALYLATRPGITGPWQVSRREGDGFAARVHLELGYSHHAGPLGDLRILVRTVGVVLDRCGVGGRQDAGDGHGAG